jgi:large subunit ribosomal protein L25
MSKMIPAVVYGHGFETIALKLDYQTFRRAFEQATYSTIVTLNIDDQNQVPVLIHEVQYNPVTDDIIHVDFYAVRMDEKVKTHIAFEFIGVSEAIKLGALMNVTKHEVEVSALPGDLVHTIPVDISTLEKIGDIIRIGQITAPKGVTFLAGAEEPVVSAIELRVIEETPVAAAPATTEGATVAGAEGAAPAAAEGSTKEAKEGAREEKKPAKDKK